MNTVPNFVRDGHHIHHCICVFHKYENIRKNIKKLKAPKDTKMQLIKQTQTICYGTSTEEVEQALDEMMGIALELSHSLDTAVRPAIPTF
jgi:copper chaperone CopZ